MKWPYSDSRLFLALGQFTTRPTTGDLTVLSLFKTEETTSKAGIFPFTANSDRGLAILLVSSALRGLVSDTQSGLVLKALWTEFETDIFRLNRIPVERLIKVLSSQIGAGSEALDRIPGILRSLGDFFFKNGKLTEFLSEITKPELAVKIMAEEIFWMGKTSVYRNKPRYFIGLAAAANALPTQWLDQVSPPITAGHFRLILNLAPYTVQKSFNQLIPAQKLLAYASLTDRISVNERWKTVFALEGYLERVGPNLFKCQSYWMGCVACPLHSHCPIGKLTKK